MSSSCSSTLLWPCELPIFFSRHHCSSFKAVSIVLVGAFYHTANFDLQIYIWPAIAIWAFDRLIRTVRTWLFNQSYFGMKTGQTMEGKTELLSEHLVRLTIRRPPRVKWTPGQYAYLTIPSVSNFRTGIIYASRTNGLTIISS